MVGSGRCCRNASTPKLVTIDRLYRAMPDGMDLNCGDALSRGAGPEANAREIVALILATATGQASKSEELGLGDYEFVPWQVGTVV